MEFNCDTFCAAPWFAIRTGQFGNLLPCCAVDVSKTEFQGKTDYNWDDNSLDEWLNSQYLEYLRRNLTKGVKLRECESCWKAEKVGQQSIRIQSNDIVTGDQGHNLTQTWLKSYFKNKESYDSDLLWNADIKISNICNYSCVMCNPSDSSQIQLQWMQQSDHPAVKYRLKNNANLLSKIQDNTRAKTGHTSLKELLSKTPRFLKLLGGEPLLDQRALNILHDAPLEHKKKISLIFVTNGSVNLVDVANKLKDYQQIMFVVSLEGVEEVQNWARKGSNWTEIANNIDQYLSQNNGPLYVSHTVQAFTLAHLGKLQQWCKDRSIPINYCNLTNPDYLSIAAIPDYIRSMAERNMGSREWQKIITMEYQPELLEPMQNYLDFYDPKQLWREIFPEWITVLDSK
jgi:molybdenum cofactor biosynthesis enzyme MoaA